MKTQHRCILRPLHSIYIFRRVIYVTQHKEYYFAIDVAFGVLVTAVAVLCIVL